MINVFKPDKMNTALYPERKFKCPKCGIELGKVTYYSCSKSECPIQIKPSY